ncbi:hypothetical protein FRB90_008718 [Tulasnella sp. 427]|nr:hypothetical protein FRB90_008718 [Tulasnella sp. 427]
MVGLAPGSRDAEENAAALLAQGLTGGKLSTQLDDDDDLSELEDGPPRKKIKTKRTSNGASKGKSKAKKAAAESGSASEEEAAPKKKSRKKPEKSDKPMDKNEDEIKRLKSFVVACGVRKKWVKEFEGLTTPAQQINKLRQILADLGMTGRLSMEKAKEIREKREFAQEMEDIQEFNAKINGPRASRSSKGKAKQGSDDEDEEMKNGDGNEDEESSPGPSRPRKVLISFTAVAILDAELCISSQKGRKSLAISPSLCSTSPPKMQIRPPGGPKGHETLHIVIVPRFLPGYPREPFTNPRPAPKPPIRRTGSKPAPIVTQVLPADLPTLCDIIRRLVMTVINLIYELKHRLAETGRVMKQTCNDIIGEIEKFLTEVRQLSMTDVKEGFEDFFWG